MLRGVQSDGALGLALRYPPHRRLAVPGGAEHRDMPVHSWFLRHPSKHRPPFSLLHLASGCLHRGLWRIDALVRPLVGVMHVRRGRALRRGRVNQVLYLERLLVPRLLEVDRSMPPNGLRMHSELHHSVMR